MCRKLFFLVSVVLLLCVAGSAGARGLLLYYKFDGSLGADLPGLVTDDSGKNIEFTKYTEGVGSLQYGQSSPIVAGSTASADFVLNGGLYRLDPYPPELMEPLRLAGEQYTIELWMKPERLDDSMADRITLIGKRGSQYDSESWKIDIRDPGDDRELRFFHHGQDEGESGLVDVGEWYHVAAVYDQAGGEENTMQFYLDGEKIERSSTVMLNPADNNEPVGIGCEMDANGTIGHFFDGLIDEIRVYDIALSPCQFQLTPAPDEYAACPNPEDGEQDVDPCGLAALGWRAANKAEWHDVYVGTDSNEVADANTSSSVYKGRQELLETCYFPEEAFEYGRTFYWRIDEVNGPNVWKGSLWSFTTAPTVDVIDNVIVYHAANRFAGWPADNGLLWTWGDDEIVVGFETGEFCCHWSGDNICGEPCSVLARSTDSGMTWTMFDPPNYVGDGKSPSPAPGGINFAHPDFAMRVSGDILWVSYERCQSWEGPYYMGNFGEPDADSWERTSRTDYIVTGPSSCLVFMSARSGDTDTDRVFCVRTTDGGATFHFRGWIVPPSDPCMAVMPSTVRCPSGRLISAVRRKDIYTGDAWIDVYCSSSGGMSWLLLGRVDETGQVEGNPPALVRLTDGRLCCAYGNRSDLKMYVKYSEDEGLTWGPRITVRADWRDCGNGRRGLGYPRIAQLANGNVICAYYWSTKTRIENHIAATIWCEHRAGDFDWNGFVGWDDLKSLASYWLNRCRVEEWCEGRDINQDSKVNFVDFAVLGQGWFKTCP